jgi:hypothetical protein
MTAAASLILAATFTSATENGKWTTARHLAHTVNTVAEEEFLSHARWQIPLFFSEAEPFTVPVGRQLDYEQLEKISTRYSMAMETYFVDATALGRDK